LTGKGFASGCLALFKRQVYGLLLGEKAGCRKKEKPEDYGAPYEKTTLDGPEVHDDVSKGSLALIFYRI
jgi:hypothetical protein